jgi:NADH-quinone oxidoreductase subunit C
VAKPDEIFSILRERLGEAVLETHAEARDPYVVFDPKAIEGLARFARDDPRLRFDLLSLISTVDYPSVLPPLGPPEGTVPPPLGPPEGTKPPPINPPGGTPGGMIEVVYFLDSTVHRHRLIAKARLDREDPRIRTVEDIWKAADWHEREAWDLMGVVFEGHHNLVRILCAEDWEGHPLRKDYVIPEEYHGIKNIVY